MDSNIATMLSRYQCQNAQDYEYALKEIIQETALSGLAGGGFFKQAAFTGGTTLRIFYNIRLPVPNMRRDPHFCLTHTSLAYSMLRHSSRPNCMQC